MPLRSRATAPAVSMDNLHDLFEHELKDIYDGESRMVDVLRKQAAESMDPQVRTAFQAHARETEKHRARLEQVFEIWGREPSRGKGCAGIEGILDEHKEFTRKDPAPAILDLFNITTASKLERYEVSAYESLIRLADQMGLEDVAKLLGKTLGEEEAALDKMQALLEADARFAKTRVGNVRNPIRNASKPSRAGRAIGGRAR